MRQLIVLEGHSVNTMIHPTFNSLTIYIPQFKDVWGGKRFLYDDTRNKDSNYLLSTQNTKYHILGQNILLVATPWGKPLVIYLEGARTGLNSLAFS